LTQIGETFDDEINLQQIAFETIFVWLLNEGRDATEGTS